ncbi:MAG: hypothetical protein KDC54_20820 [Lewinella sp.]|nr:hypothetical protein [Lewinella sp.]
MGLEPDPPVDPSLFNDPLAEQLDWQPVRKGGDGFRTHQLERTELHLMEITPTRGLLLFASAIMALPLLGMVFLLSQDDIPVFVFFFCGLASLFGLFMLYRAKKVTVFDQRSRMCTGYFRSWGNWFPPARHIPFDQIHALQILRERVRSKNHNYWSYELNLVLHNGERYMLMDHANQAAIREDAQALGRMLSVPVWDATRQLEN